MSGFKWVNKNNAAEDYRNYRADDAESGNRLVGIISHVAELKDRIDRKIIVTRGANGGSSITYEIE